VNRFFICLGPTRFGVGGGTSLGASGRKPPPPVSEDDEEALTLTPRRLITVPTRVGWLTQGTCDAHCVDGRRGELDESFEGTPGFPSDALRPNASPSRDAKTVALAIAAPFMRNAVALGRRRGRPSAVSCGEEAVRAGVTR
jgi:hypothetical protein